MRQLSLLALAAALSTAASAHHSRSAFLLDDQVRVEGVLTEYSWSNPHMYFTVVAPNDAGGVDEWTFEGSTVSAAQRVDWRKDALEIGENVVVAANPNSDPNNRFAYLISLTNDSGETFSTRSEGGAAQPAATPVDPSTDFSGVWTLIRPGFRASQIGGHFNKPTDVPVTALGQAQLDSFDHTENPYYRCIMISVPRVILGSYGYRFEHVDDDTLVITKEHSNRVRAIHMDGAPMPADFVPDMDGYSIGHFESDSVLVVETTGFAATQWGTARGVDSSDQKRSVERYTLSDDGLGYSVAYTIEDPVYLAEPYSVSGRFRKVADYPFGDEPPCDPDTASRHLQAF